MLDSEDDWKDEVRKNRVALIDSLEVSNVLDHLISQGVISLLQSEGIRHEKSRYKKAEMLLDYINRRPKADFIHFIKALRQTNQRHLVQLISGQRAAGEEPWKRSLKVNLISVLEDLDVDSVMSYLISSGVITMIQSESIREACRTRLEKAQKLIDHLERRTETDFWKFLDALENTGQEHIASLLGSRVPKPRPPRNANDQFRPEQPVNHPQSETPQDTDFQSQKRYKQEMEMELDQEEVEAIEEEPFFRLEWRAKNKTAELASMLTSKLKDARHETIINYFSNIHKAHLINFKEESTVVFTDHQLEDEIALAQLVQGVSAGTLKKEVLEMFIQNDPFRGKQLTQSNLTITIDEGMHAVLLQYFRENKDNVPCREEAAASHLAKSSTFADVPAHSTPPVFKSEPEPHDESGSTTTVRPNTTIPQHNQSERTDTGISTGSLFTMIRKIEYSVYDFEGQLRNMVSQKMDIASIINAEGLSILHYIVYRARLTFLVAIHRSGIWQSLYNVKVRDGMNSSQLGGMTAMQIAEKRPTSRKIIHGMKFYEQWEESMPEICRAARVADEKRVKYLMEKDKVNPKQKDHAGVNVLYWACVGGSIQLVEYLLNKGLSPKVKSESGQTLLHICASLGHSHILDMLLDMQYMLDALAKDNEGKTPVDRNAENGDMDVLQVLVKHRVPVSGRVLPLAAFYGRLPFIKQVLEVHGAAIDIRDDKGQTALLTAAEAQQADTVKYFLSKEVDLCITNQRGRNIFHILADVGDELIFKEVLKRLSENQVKELLTTRDKYDGGELCFLLRGTDKSNEAWYYVEVKRMYVDVFVACSRSGSVTVTDYGAVICSGLGADPEGDLKQFIDRRFEENCQANKTFLDSTPLHIAVFKKHKDMAEALLHAGADANIQDCFGMTPVHVAAMRGDLAMIKAMEEKGASLTVTNDFNQTAYEVAVANRHQDVINYLSGKDYLARTQHFVSAEVPVFLTQLQPGNLNRVGEEGTDVRQHIVSVLREMMVGINELLLDIGSGPVQEATSESMDI